MPSITLDFQNFQEAVQLKLDSVTDAKEMLLLSKAIESILNSSSTELTYSAITTTLGFVPYSAANPSGYITSAAAAAAYQSLLVSGSNIKTINGNSILGSGNIQIDGGVTSFNARTGAISLSSLDVSNALGFSPAPATSTLPAGGTVGQVLSKIDATNYNAQWMDNFATDIRVLVKNTTGATLTKGTAVYISGANGANILVSKSQANAESTSSKTFGLLLQDLANNATGYVVCEGVLTGVDTSLATANDPVWLSPTVAGGIVFGLANKPVAPYHMVYLGIVSRASASNGEIQVKVQNGYEIGELHDVLIVSPATNDFLTRAADGLWKNTQLSSSHITSALGFTPYGSDNPSGFITSSALSPYLTSETAASTYQTQADMSSYLTSTAAASAYQPLLVSGTSIKTINGSSILGSGDIAISDGTKLPLNGGTMTGSLNFTSGTKITGDFSNASYTNRVHFQSSTANGSTVLSILPNGTSVNSQVNIWGNSDPTNAPLGAFVVDTDSVRLQSSASGTGTVLPLSLWVGESEAARIAKTTLNLLIGTSTDNIVDKLQVDGSISATGLIKSRVVTIDPSATSITLDSDTTDFAFQINTRAAGTLTINAPTGTPTNGQKLMLRMNSANVQTFSWDTAAFTGSTDQALPTATSGGGKKDYMGFIYDSSSSKWHLIAKNFGF